MCITNGVIDQIVEPSDDKYLAIRRQAEEANELIVLSENQFLLPGFIDLHVHAPQWPNAGVALDKPLNEWLNDYTFPLEAKFEDTEFASKVYHNLVEELIAEGTTTVQYFGTIYKDSNLELAKACIDAGQRGFIGQVVMDNKEESPDYYRNESGDEAVESTKQFIAELAKLNQDGAVKQTPVITPRFLPSCTIPTLKRLGKLAQELDLPIQSHCSESDWENGYAIEHYGKRDSAVLEECGLLTANSVMAHGTLLNDEDLDRFKHRQVAVAHCPVSNVYFGNAVTKVRQILDSHVKVGMGTDISGGFSPSIYRNISQAVMSSRMLADGVDSDLDPADRGVANSAISAKEAFYLATAGGAEALNLNAGKIEVGKLADLQVVSSAYPSFTKESSDDRFEKLMYQTTKANVDRVFVNGKQVKGE
ncbi:amidohydrolase family protein [Lentilactobacillus sp. Marseille-Q4993]|uniref:amidohydrolase family protein n=1 Tax=Lentilactobacillus sp. Marseille-Q4993 TaxID=3039492 RepID=UPI0024BD065C|nr:amidohydrolase family protein [Lentilactobacillus sp. Marseille-Q4993]